MDGKKERSDCHLHKDGGQGKEKKSEYMTKSRGPSTEPCIPNQDDRRVIKMLWSMVSKAAERSRRQKQ